MTITHELNTTFAPDTPELSELGVSAYTIPKDDQEFIRQLDLPRGYGLIGGGARAIASDMLCGQEVPIRDIDVAAFAEYGPDESYGPSVSRRLMPDDSKFGHGVQFTNLADYFKSRDFTINELAVVDDQLLITPQAESDLRQNVIRPTELEHNPDRNWYLHPRLAVKAVLMQTVMESSTGQLATIEGVDLRNYHCDVTDGDGDGWTRPFYVSLGFQKALEHGEETAERFLDNLVSYGMVRAASLEHSDDVAERLAGFARELEQASDFVFRGAAAEHLEALHELAGSQYSLGDLLYEVNREALDNYDHYHDVAQSYGGNGRQWTDESKY